MRRILLYYFCEINFVLNIFDLGFIVLKSLQIQNFGLLFEHLKCLIMMFMV